MRAARTFVSILSVATILPSTADPVPEGLERSDWQSIRAAHEAWKHEFREVDGQWQATNPGQRWTTTFDGRGFLATPKEASWTWGLRLESYGFGSNQQPVSGTPEIKVAGQRLSYHWQGGLEEWFVNDGRGLEHGFIVADRPAGALEGEPLAFTIGTMGSLKPSISSDQLTVHFRDKAGAPVLNYSGLKVWDAECTILKSWFERGNDGQFRIAVEEAGARYPITIDPIAQQAYLKASNTGASDSFGFAVSVSGDTVVVGASGEDSSTTGVNSTPDEGAADSGAAYVFIRSGTVWSQQAYLKASNTGGSDFFGRAVNVSGNTVVVGAWQEDSSSTGVNSFPNEGASNAGAAYVFVRSGTTWSQQAYLKAGNTGLADLFGYSVAVSGDTVVVGAPYEDSNTTGVNSTPNESAAQAGAAYVFTRSGTVWSQQAYLKASNSGSSDQFGNSVDVSGDAIAIGAPHEDSITTGVNSTPDNSASNAGAAYVFTRGGTTWTQQAYLKASNTGANDEFGWSVALSSDTMVAGARYEGSNTTGVNSTPNESAAQAGAAYVFTRAGTVWSQQAYLKASNTGATDQFGTSVAVAEDTLVIGAPNEDSSTIGVNSSQNNSATDAGAAYVFTRIGMTWSQQAYLKASNSGGNDGFGISVAVSGDTVAVGSQSEDSGTTGVNSTPNESTSQAGAAYVFTGLGPVITSPEIALEQPALTGLTDGVSSIGFGSVTVGDSSSRVFTVRNTGNGDLTGIAATFSGGNVGDFAVASAPAATLFPGASTTFTVTFTPGASGSRGSTLRVASNDADENPFDIALTGQGVSAQTAYNNAIASTSLTGNDALPTATPFGDGVENLLKYAFNMNLAGPDASTLPPGTGTSGLPSITTPAAAPAGTLRFEFLRRKGSGLIYTPEKSTTLDNPSWLPLTAAPAITSINDQWERVIYTEAPDPVPAPACFGRVEVTLP